MKYKLMIDGKEYVMARGISIVEDASPQSQQWTTAGTYSFTVPAGVTSITVEVAGGGGGGKGLYDDVWYDGGEGG